MRKVLPRGRKPLLLVAAVVLAGSCRAEFRTGSGASSRSSREAAEKHAWLASWADVVAAEPDPLFVADPHARSLIAGANLPWLVRDRGLGIEMVLVPSGSFEESGSDESGGEHATHRVAVPGDFYLGRFEVSQEEWARAMAENPSEFREDPRLPVDSVAWELLVDPTEGFLHATGFDLPTEAEWEWAARGPDGRPYPWGAVADVCDANFADETDKIDDPIRCVLCTAPVGSYFRGASWCGALDLAGNVLEWCHEGPAPDAPCGVLRGGAWFSSSDEIRSTARLAPPAGYANNGFGLRVVRRVPPPS